MSDFMDWYCGPRTPAPAVCLAVDATFTACGKRIESPSARNCDRSLVTCSACRATLKAKEVAEWNAQPSYERRHNG